METHPNNAWREGLRSFARWWSDRFSRSTQRQSRLLNRGVEGSNDANSESLRRLVYRSLACCELSQIERIFCDSQSHNVQSGITGILFVSGPRFYQCLEGPHDRVQVLFDRICKDTRHCMVEVLDDRPSTLPLYPYWSMGALLGYESVIQSVVPLLDSGNEYAVQVGLEMLAMSMAHQDARANDTGNTRRMLELMQQRAGFEPQTQPQLATPATIAGNGPWLSLLAENMYLRAQLVRAEAGRREFFSAISHEMRTPMTGMLSAAEMICHPRFNPAMMERQRDALKSSSDRFAKTLNDIFTLHRIESGDQQLNKRSTNLHDELQAACHALQGAGIQLNVTASDGALARCELDADLLRIVLDNLLTHAIKRTHNGRVDTQLRLLAVSRDRLWWRMAIRDYGSHVTMERLLTLFQPFSAGLDQGGAYVEDSGLDLALAGAIVKLLNGRMGAHNEPDGGVTVWFTVGVDRHYTGSVRTISQPVAHAG